MVGCEPWTRLRENKTVIFSTLRSALVRGEISYGSKKNNVKQSKNINNNLLNNRSARSNWLGSIVKTNKRIFVFGPSSVAASFYYVCSTLFGMVYVSIFLYKMSTHFEKIISLLTYSSLRYK